MNYKRLIKSRDVRLKVLKLFEFIPDKPMIQFQYWLKTGRRLKLNKPTRFTEKLQWYKLYYRNPLMTQCADKYSVREYVESKGFKDILVPLYGVYERAEDIDFEKLPRKFVLKSTNGSQTNILCTDKIKLNIEDVKKTLNYWAFKRTAKAGREWPYYDIKPRIICEKFLETDNNQLIDYKFFCFSGRVEYVFVSMDREDEDMRMGIFDRDFRLLPYKRVGLSNLDREINKPVNYDRMVQIAEKLSEEFPHVRVDLYNISGEIKFGELTFFHGSGYVEFEPDEFDFILGDKFDLTKMF